MSHTLPVAERWFERAGVDDAITLLWEPHVVPLMRCNIWHVRGRDRDLVIDTGMGVTSLTEAAIDLFDRPITAVATHGHADHIGGHHEFADVVIHPLEAELLDDPELRSLDPALAWGQETLDDHRAMGYEMAERYFVTALPPGVAFESFAQRPALVTRTIEEGDTIDVGDRHYEVLHLPRTLPRIDRSLGSGDRHPVLRRRDLRRAAARRVGRVGHRRLLHDDGATLDPARHRRPRRSRPQLRPGASARTRAGVPRAPLRPLTAAWPATQRASSRIESVGITMPTSVPGAGTHAVPSFDNTVCSS